MGENMIGGAALTNWLAIIGIISLMYWGWRIVAAFQHRGGGDHNAVDTPAAGAAVLAPPQPGPLTPPAEDIAAIAAAVYAILGAHRIVRLETIRSDQVWSSEGRWMQQTSHSPR
jgi:hypothetical protein